MNGQGAVFRALLAGVTTISIALAFTYDRDAAVGYGEEWWDGRNTPKYMDYSGTAGGDCANFGSQCLIAGGIRFSRYRPNARGGQTNPCNDLAYNMSPDDKGSCINNAGALRKYLKGIIGAVEVPMTDGLPTGVQRGDIVFLVDPVSHQPTHTLVITEIINGGQDAHYVCHSADRNSKDGPALPLLQDPSLLTDGMIFMKIPDEISDEKFSWNQDSSFTLGESRYVVKCCWKELIGPPWSQVQGDTNFSYYACLNWDVSGGWTWDTLISPRINLSGCTEPVLHQLTVSTLRRSSATALEIRGSINDGASWPYSVGNESTTVASIPWAANQSSVRLAWIYVGRVQSDRYWAIDDIRITGNPYRQTDACLGQVRAPTGIISHGRRVVPSVHLWNLSREPETIAVTSRIGAQTNETRSVLLYPFRDSVVEFSEWVATPGTYAVTAFCALSSDQFAGNDTVVMTVRVVADTWVQRYGLGNDIARGAALRRVSDDSLYLLRGATMPSRDFVLYRVGADIWKRRAAAPSGFQAGSDLAYPDGDYIYVCDGSQNFFRYHISTNTWSQLASVPANMGSGGGLAWAGGNYIYAVRGFETRGRYPCFC